MTDTERDREKIEKRRKEERESERKGMRWREKVRE